MKKLINDVDDLLAESLDGFATAHADIVTLGAERQFMRRRNVKPGKVALISGGGSGHEPLHAGFVGHGMLDVLYPVADALAEGQPTGQLIEIAHAAAAATKDVKAIRGRASFLGDRALGHVDPGSRSVALITVAICDSL